MRLRNNTTHLKGKRLAVFLLALTLIVAALAQTMAYAETEDPGENIILEEDQTTGETIIIEEDTPPDEDVILEEDTPLDEDVILEEDTPLDEDVILEESQTPSEDEDSGENEDSGDNEDSGEDEDSGSGEAPADDDAAIAISALEGMPLGKEWANGNTRLTAASVEVTYEVGEDVDPSDVIGMPDPSTETKPIDEVTVTDKVPLREGYDFNGWFVKEHTHTVELIYSDRYNNIFFELIDTQTVDCGGYAKLPSSGYFPDSLIYLYASYWTTTPNPMPGDPYYNLEADRALEDPSPITSDLRLFRERVLTGRPAPPPPRRHAP